VDLTRWAERALREVSEEGDCVERIRLLSTDGAAWETWTRPFSQPEQWVEDAERVVNDLVQDWPAVDIQLLFVAENRAGLVVSQCTKRTRGRQKGAQNGVFGGPSNALAESMASQARTTERILATANTQLDVLQATITALQNQNIALMAENARLHTELNNARPVIDPELVSGVRDMMPVLLQAFIDRNGKG